MPLFKCEKVYLMMCKLYSDFMFKLMVLTNKYVLLVIDLNGLSKNFLSLESFFQNFSL